MGNGARRLIMSQPSNTVTIEAWNGVLFDRFVRLRGGERPLHA